MLYYKSRPPTWLTGGEPKDVRRDFCPCQGLLAIMFFLGGVQSILMGVLAEMIMANAVLRIASEDETYSTLGEVRARSPREAGPRGKRLTGRQGSGLMAHGVGEPTGSLWPAKPKKPVDLRSLPGWGWFGHV